MTYMQGFTDGYDTGIAAVQSTLNALEKHDARAQYQEAHNMLISLLLTMKESKQALVDAKKRCWEESNDNK